MDKKSLKLLSKDDLIEIITSDSMWQRKAFMKVINIVHKKVNAIIDEQEKCDICTVTGRAKYEELEKQYKKWSDIQMRL